jgi:hypothetical protein
MCSLIKLNARNSYRVVEPFADGIPNALVVQAKLLLDNILVGDEAVLTARQLALHVQSEQLAQFLSNVLEISIQHFL